MHKEKYLKGTTAVIDPYDADSDEDDPEVLAAKWTWGKAPISCPWVKETKGANDFDIKEADKIFDLLLEKKQLRLRKKYYKFHNATNHNTNEFKIFRQHIQRAIEHGKIKFKPAKKSAMDIDRHPFPRVHMVEF